MTGGTGRSGSNKVAIPIGQRDGLATKLKATDVAHARVHTVGQHLGKHVAEVIRTRETAAAVHLLALTEAIRANFEFLSRSGSVAIQFIRHRLLLEKRWGVQFSADLLGEAHPRAEHDDSDVRYQDCPVQE